MITVFEGGEYVGGLVFFVTANASYCPEEDIGWRQVYEFDRYNYIVIDPNDTTKVATLNPLFN